MTRVAIKGGYLEVASAGEPGYPDQGLPENPPGIDNSLPMPPPPPGVWPPGSPQQPWVPFPDQGLPEGGEPAEPGTIWPPVGNGADGKFWVVAGIPGVGWRYIAVDLSLQIDHELPGQQPGIDQGLPGRQPHPGNRPPGSRPPRPDQGLPPSAQPKT